MTTETQGGMNLNHILLGLAALLVVLGVAYWAL